jgi:hypothetical protein
MISEKVLFLKGEIWSLTVSGAFQRANVYISKPNEIEKSNFKKDLLRLIDKISEEYDNHVSYAKHIENIKSINSALQSYKAILSGGQLKFGVSQKLLNLYLKYLWCLDIIKVPPPHFPVDRQIQEKMKIKVSNWTGHEFGEEQYRFIIDQAEQFRAEFNSKFSNIAEFELYLFSHTGDIKTMRKSYLKNNSSDEK